MKNSKKKVPASVILMFVAALGLMMFSAVGGARAALTYFSDNYDTGYEMYHIGVTLNENGEAVNWRNYDTSSRAFVAKAPMGTLLSGIEDDGFKFGTQYEEELTVTNSGEIPEFVRVTIYKYWLDKDGKDKDTTLDPSYIQLKLANTSQWVEDKSRSTTERTILYYTKSLSKGETTVPFASSLTVDSATKAIATQTTSEKDGITTIITTYDYSQKKFCVEVQVDAVQTHNGANAVKSAWGENVSVSLSADEESGTLSVN